MNKKLDVDPSLAVTSFLLCICTHPSQIKACFSNIACGLKFFYNIGSLKLHFTPPTSPKSGPIVAPLDLCCHLSSPDTSWLESLLPAPDPRQLYCSSDPDPSSQNTSIPLPWQPAQLSHTVTKQKEPSGVNGSIHNDGRCLTCSEKMLSVVFLESLFHCFTVLAIRRFFPHVSMKSLLLRVKSCPIVMV